MALESKALRSLQLLLFEQQASWLTRTKRKQQGVLDWDGNVNKLNQMKYFDNEETGWMQRLWDYIMSSEEALSDICLHPWGRSDEISRQKRNSITSHTPLTQTVSSAFTGGLEFLSQVFCFGVNSYLNRGVGWSVRWCVLVRRSRAETTFHNMWNSLHCVIQLTPVETKLRRCGRLHTRQFSLEYILYIMCCGQMTG